ncbi:unnamed protein product [Miscanthus lutarioriparius]|uniref:Uncharacterized protein n=1 Tax=Miscanthus lutarioriparius TaxID=422564 RepID=A0A811NEP8_9POAL|nr:unnamed protein product [Miscanthus lutarioriparius]
MGHLEVLTARDGLLPRSACRYQRLRGGGTSPAPGGSVRARRPLRLRRRACKAAGRWGATTTAASGGGKRLRLRLRLVRLLLLLPARRVAALVAELLRRLAAAAAAAEAAADCPAIVFSSQWGLPVLSHSGSTASSRSSRLRAFYLDRSLSASSSGTGGSPC